MLKHPLHNANLEIPFGISQILVLPDKKFDQVIKCIKNSYFMMALDTFSNDSFLHKLMIIIFKENITILVYKSIIFRQII